MKTSLLLAGVLTLGMASSAFAQDVSAQGQSSAAQNSGTAQTGPGDSMGSMSGPASGTYTDQHGSVPNGNAGEAALPSLPNDGTAPSGRANTDYGTLAPENADTTPGVNLPPTTRNAGTTETRLPLKGANSFTEAEAKHRLEKAGYTQVSPLAKDDQSIWRGTAMKGDVKVAVSLDYKGNIKEDTK